CWPLRHPFRDAAAAFFSCPRNGGCPCMRWGGKTHPALGRKNASALAPGAKTCYTVPTPMRGESNAAAGGERVGRGASPTARRGVKWGLEGPGERVNQYPGTGAFRDRGKEWGAAHG